MGKRPDPNVVIVGPVAGWWATWRGGEYIEIFPDRATAKAEARGEQATPVHVLNTTGDEIGPDRRAYVLAQLTEWEKQDGRVYRDNL